MARREKVEEARTRLLDEGIELFSEYGFHGIGLKDLLIRVGVPKGSFYHYFESKEEFGALVTARYAEQFRERLAAFLDAPEGKALDRIRRFLDAATTLFEHEGFQHGCLLGTLGAEISDTAESCRQAVATSLEAIAKDFEKTIAQGQGDGSIRDDRPAAELADLLVNSLEGALLRMKIDRSAKPLRQFRELIIDGLFPPR